MRPSGGCEGSVVRGDDEVRSFPVSPEQSGREVKRIQRPEDGRKRLSSASENQPVELHHIDVSERSKEDFPSIGDLLVGQERAKAMPIEGAETFDLCKGAGHSPFDRLPLEEALGLTEDDAQ